MLCAAKVNFAKFYLLDVENINLDMINATSLGVEGWSDDRMVVRDYDQIDAGRRTWEDSNPGANPCWAFGASDDMFDDGAAKHNLQVLHMIEALGKHGSGKRAVVKALAARQGIVDEDQLELLYSGSPGVKLKVPSLLRQALEKVGLGNVLAPVNILTVAGPAEILVNTAVWEDIELEVALGSGSVVHVCAPRDIPGYMGGESAGSR